MVMMNTTNNCSGGGAGDARPRPSQHSGQVRSGQRLKRDKKLAQEKLNFARQNLESLTQRLRESTDLLAERRRTLAQERRTLADQNAQLERMENQLVSIL
ncbi:hypothetical protein ACFE04_029974 [Oxalis oulophora]